MYSNILKKVGDGVTGRNLIANQRNRRGVTGVELKKVLEFREKRSGGLRSVRERERSSEQ